MQGILIIAPNWIGDAVMTQPLLASLKAQYPESKIDVLASTWVAPIYRACSEVHDVIEAKFEHKQLQWGLRKELANKLAAKKYQACFVLPNSYKSALIPWLANIPFRIGYRGELRFGLINLALDNPSKVNRPPMVEHYLALSQLLNNEQASPTTGNLTPKLNVSAVAADSVQAKLKNIHIDQANIYVMCPGAEYGTTKRWPTSNFAELAQSIVTNNPTNQIILLGSKGDYALAQEIETKAKRDSHIHNWCGDTSLDEAIALIGMSKTVISNDSGLMHVAAALDKKLIALYGSSDPNFTPPLHADAKILNLNLSCSPCFKRECPFGHTNCLAKIEPASVMAAIDA